MKLLNENDLSVTIPFIDVYFNFILYKEGVGIKRGDIIIHLEVEMQKIGVNNERFK